MNYILLENRLDFQVQFFIWQTNKGDFCVITSRAVEPVEILSQFNRVERRRGRTFSFIVVDILVLYCNRGSIIAILVLNIEKP